MSPSRADKATSPNSFGAKGVISDGSSNGDIGLGSPESERGEPHGGGATDGELGRGPSRCDVGVEGGDDRGVQQDAHGMENTLRDDALSCDGSDTMDSADVREIGQVARMTTYYPTFLRVRTSDHFQIHSQTRWNGGTVSAFGV